MCDPASPPARALLTFLLLCAACSQSQPRAELPRKAAASAPQASSAPVAPSATACAATPSTVYGDEPVVFQVEGEGGGNVTLEVTDERGQLASRTTGTVPGQLRLPGLPSGDFVLEAGSKAVSCRVTVNREQPRATPAPP